jgi:hypothetical protein
LKAATIEFGGGAIDCILRHVSKNGAAFEVTSPVGFPEQISESGHLENPACAGTAGSRRRRQKIKFPPKVLCTVAAPIDQLCFRRPLPRSKFWEGCLTRKS